MDDHTCNIVIGGEAGQGLVTVGRLLARSLVRRGYSVVVTQGYQSRIRGGHNTFAVRASSREIIAPQEPIDLLVALNAETVSLHADELSPRGWILIGADQKIDALKLDPEKCIRVPYGDLASSRFINTAALGVACALLGLKRGVVSELLAAEFGKKDVQSLEKNEQALAAAFGWAADLNLSFEALPVIESPVRRIMMNGNEAIAMGALSAGLKFYSFYPMTPATSLGLTLASAAGRMGILVEQAEDEIAAINMAIGASFAGAPAMVGTSGGGFALMVEGVSLAAMTETPVVIMIGQRPAPATGLPTRTEQADLEFVLHSGHGEFPRAILAPGSVEECFHLTRQAFMLAEKYQGPVFILTDQFLADSYRAIAPFDVENLLSVSVGCKEAVTSPYRRFAITESGVSSRLLPGLSQHLVVADSDEHEEDGHLTEDLSLRKRMVQKRLKKAWGLEAEVVKPEYSGPGAPDLLLVSWGSTGGAVHEAAVCLQSREVQVATLHFSQVWPFVAGHFLGRLEKARRVVCIEGNATGQFARLIRRETGFEIKEKILRYDGLPITPEYILRALEP